MSQVLFVLFLSLPMARLSAAAEEVIRFDFESGDLQGWQVVEGRFDYLVSDRDVYHNRYAEAPDRKYNKQGKYYLSTVEQQPGMPSNDRMTGVVESPVFRLTGSKMSMLIGSGTSPQAYVALCTLDGKEVLQGRGRAQTEILQRVEWNAPQLVGQPVFLRVVDRETGGWGHVTLDDFTAQGTLDAEATRQRFGDVDARRRRARLEAALRETNLPALRAAVEDRIQRYPGEYPRGEEFLTRLDRIEQEFETRLSDNPAALPTELLEELATLQHEALPAHPRLAGRPILFVVRHQYRSHYHAVDTLFSTDELNADRGCRHADLFQGGGALKMLDLATGKVKTLLEVPEGVARDPEVDFSGERIVFALRRHKEEDYHIWEMDIDGSNLRQLTRAERVADFDPIYLPDGGIAFSSTREPKYNQCSRDIGANLFRMEADGANIRQIGKNNLFDNQAALTHDGRILYARWEYVDRNFGDAHSLWTVNSDGTNQALFWGNNTASPGAALAARVIPDSQRVVCVFGPHHDHLWGAMAVIDRRRGIDGRSGVVHIWPAEWIDRIRTGGRFDCDAFSGVKRKYADPWPLDETTFLVSRMIGRGDQMGIYLVDTFGNELLLHTEAPGCYDPMPIEPRRRPPILPARAELDQREGFFYVADVYHGTHMRGVARGSVKYLRVVEAPEKRHWAPGAWFGQGYTAPGMNWHSLENKRILGTVPVEPDGSAYFAVPAETFVYFQLLDENGMMVQSMRSGASVQPGERIGCVGCHEDRRTTALTSLGTSTALSRPPSRPEEWHGPARDFGFMAEVQPVLTKHCQGCHDYGKPAGEKLNLAPDRDITFNTAYNELWRKGYVRCVGAGPAEVQPAKSWGSHASALIREMRNPQVPEHKDLRLTAEDLDRLITWTDLNGVYYPSYACAYPDSLTGRCPLDGAQLGRLAELTGVPFGNLRSYNANRGPQITFERPEWSPCLKKFSDTSDPDYREALAIIAAGRDQLQARPRADMPGFQPSRADRAREEKYALRRRIEHRNREAILRGIKVYDRAPGEAVKAQRP